MTLLLIGLIIFLGTHSVNMLAHEWRGQMVGKLGLLPWKGIYALVSLVGFVLLVRGYGEARLDPTFLWYPPVWTKHLAALLTLPAFILLFGSAIPGNRLSVKLGHPQVLGVKVWATAHLICNGTLADVLLFGGFLVWAIANFAISRRRDRAEGVVREHKGAARDIATIAIGLIAWAVFALYLHRVLIGISPMG